MRFMRFGGAVALAVGILCGPTHAAGGPIGEYLEARSCNVFIGACHYGAEYVTTGREAVMAWRVSSGSYDGVDLAGMAAAAVVVADLNLAEAEARRSGILYVDASASPAQRAAMVAFLKKQYGAALGEVVAVRTAPIQFSRTGAEYQLKVGDDARLVVLTDVDRSCCNQPMERWYAPLGPTSSSAVGFARVNEFTGEGLASTWRRADQNSAFYGTFAF